MKDRGTENHIYRGERRGKTNVLYFKLCKLRYIRLFTGEYPRSFPDLFLTVLPSYLLRIRFIFTSVVLDVSFYFCTFVCCMAVPSKLWQTKSGEVILESPLAGGNMRH